MDTNQIIKCEQSLLHAIASNDLKALDILLHDELLFTLPTGQTITKAMDMEVYKSGNMNVTSIKSSEQQISIISDTAIVAVTIALEGNYFEHLLDGQYRYTRVWKLFEKQWKVIAGSCIAI